MAREPELCQPQEYDVSLDNLLSDFYWVTGCPGSFHWESSTLILLKFQLRTIYIQKKGACSTLCTPFPKPNWSLSNNIFSPQPLIQAHPTTMDVVDNMEVHDCGSWWLSGNHTSPAPMKWLVWRKDLWKYPEKPHSSNNKEPYWTKHCWFLQL